jgi:PleD family two-component response regulator
MPSPARPADGGVAPASDSGARAPGTQAPVRILAVDDRPENLRAIRSVLAGPE